MKYVRATLVCAVIALAAQVAPVSARSARHFSFVLLHFTPTGYVDNPPVSGIDDPGPGDLLTAHSTVYDARAKRAIGRTSELCIVTVRRPLTMDCSIALIFRNGSQLLVRGAIDPTRTPWRAIVVGGYGRYAGARGWVRETGFRAGERMTVTLL